MMEENYLLQIPTIRNKREQVFTWIFQVYKIRTYPVGNAFLPQPPPQQQQQQQQQKRPYKGGVKCSLFTCLNLISQMKNLSNIKVPIAPNYKGVCLQNTSKPHSYHLHLKIW